MVSKKRQALLLFLQSRDRTELTAIPPQVTLTLIRSQHLLRQAAVDRTINPRTLVPPIFYLSNSTLIPAYSLSAAAPTKASGTAGPGAAMGDYTTQNKQMRHDELFRLYLVFQEMRIAGVQVMLNSTYSLLCVNYLSLVIQSTPTSILRPNINTPLLSHSLPSPLSLSQYSSFLSYLISSQHSTIPL
jgi:hypothetical protein